MPIKYDPENFPPSQSSHIDFDASSNKVLEQINSDTPREQFQPVVERLGKEVGSSLMANVSNLDLVVRLADGLSDTWGLLTHGSDMNFYFMASAIEGAKDEGIYELEYQAMNAINQLRE